MFARVCNRCKKILDDSEGINISEIVTGNNKLSLDKNVDLCGKCYDEFVIVFLGNIKKLVNSGH